ncbi:MAG: PLDc N-terminal domain-containing protein [Phycisphaeraceae bacterium]
MPRLSGSVLGIAGVLLGLSQTVLAQMSPSRRQQDEEAAAAAACAMCGGCGIAIILLVVAIIALNIALLVWVARDAKARGMDSSALWMLLVMFTGLIGLLIYILSRPQGQLVSCPHCQNKRLQVSAKCPHCGNA